MTVLVGMPYFGAPELVERAVCSVLDQTVRDLVLAVIADGDDPPLGAIHDERLVVYRLPENRGAYFAQQVALQANPFAWYAPHGADDWTEPNHLERLLAMTARADAIATGAVWFHNLDGTTKVHFGTYEVGLFATERLRAIGGYNPAERIAQDTLTMRLLRLTGTLAESGAPPTYHRIRRPGSLTTAPETGLGTPGRNAVRARNREAYWRAVQIARPEKIRADREKRTPPALAAEVELHAAALRARLS